MRPEDATKPATSRQRDIERSDWARSRMALRNIGFGK
jgi:hypothetical protein